MTDFLPGGRWIPTVALCVVVTWFVSPFVRDIDWGAVVAPPPGDPVLRHRTFASWGAKHAVALAGSVANPEVA